MKRSLLLLLFLGSGVQLICFFFFHSGELVCLMSIYLYVFFGGSIGSHSAAQNKNVFINNICSEKVATQSNDEPLLPIIMLCVFLDSIFVGFALWHFFRRTF